MSFVEGWLMRGDGFVRGGITFVEGAIGEAFEGLPGKLSRPKGIRKNERALAKGIIIPTFVNSHTHVADTSLRAQVASYYGTLEGLVAPPNGIKHRYLSKVSMQELANSIATAVSEMEASGTSAFIDFREGGIEGVRLLGRLIGNSSIKALPLSRPRTSTFDKKEIDALLDDSIGLGISSYVDWPEDEIKKAASRVKERGKMLGIHASERVREDIEKVLSLSPTFLVHMLEATDDDLALVADEGVPIVLCPRSNAFFGKMPSIPLMLEKGIKLMLGTDNGMLCAPDMFREMEAAFRVSRLAHSAKNAKKIVKPFDILKMALHNPRTAFMNANEEWLEGVSDLMVVRPSSLRYVGNGEECAGALVHASKGDIALMYREGAVIYAREPDSHRDGRLALFGKSSRRRARDRFRSSRKGNSGICS